MGSIHHCVSHNPILWFIIVAKLLPPSSILSSCCHKHWNKTGHVLYHTRECVICVLVWPYHRIACFLPEYEIYTCYNTLVCVNYTIPSEPTFGRRVPARIKVFLCYDHCYVLWVMLPHLEFMFNTSSCVITAIQRTSCTFVFDGYCSHAIHLTRVCNLSLLAYI